MQCEADGSRGSHQRIPFQALTKLTHSVLFLKSPALGNFTREENVLGVC